MIFPLFHIDLLQHVKTTEQYGHFKECRASKIPIFPSKWPESFMNSVEDKCLQRFHEYFYGERQLAIVVPAYTDFFF